MNNKSSSKKRFIRQLSYIVVIMICAIVTWFKNEQKSQPTPKTTETQNIPLPAGNLGDYDSVMAKDSIGQNSSAPVDYYMLVLSWSPAFCDLQRERNEGKMLSHLAYQCNNADKFGWVIHGLWAQNSHAVSPADHPRYCQGDLPPLPEALIRQYLPESPGASLLQGEWEKHGACIFNQASDYFTKQKALFDGLTLPPEMLPRKELFAWLKRANPQLKNAYLGATKNELFICYNKNWQVIDCPH